MQKLTKVTLGKLSASDMRELFGGANSDSVNTRFTKKSECCDGQACTRANTCACGYYVWVPYM